MIGTTVAADLIGELVFTGFLGIGTGGLLCMVLRRRYGLKDALIDTVLASVVTTIAAYLVSTIESARSWDFIMILVLAITVGSVVLRHLLPLASRSKE